MLMKRKIMEANYPVKPQVKFKLNNAAYLDEGKMQMAIECLLDIGDILDLCNTTNADLLTAIVICQHSHCCVFVSLNILLFIT